MQLSLSSHNHPEGVLLIAVPGGYRAAKRSEVLEAARHFIQHEEVLGQRLDKPASVRDFLQLRLAGLDYEMVAILLLDAQLRVIDYLEMFRGTVSQASVYPREVAKVALLRAAVSVMMVHNHPSGSRDVSLADRRITEHMKQALGLVDIRLVDHWIVAGSDIVSMAEKGLV